MWSPPRDVRPSGLQVKPRWSHMHTDTLRMNVAALIQTASCLFPNAVSKMLSAPLQEYIFGRLGKGHHLGSPAIWWGLIQLPFYCHLFSTVSTNPPLSNRIKGSFCKTRSKRRGRNWMHPAKDWHWVRARPHRSVAGRVLQPKVIFASPLRYCTDM